MASGIYVSGKIGFVQVGIVHDNQRIVAAQLQYHATISNAGGDVFADGHAAGKCDELDSRVGQKFAGDLSRVAGDDLKHLRRQAGFVQHVRQ